MTKIFTKFFESAAKDKQLKRIYNAHMKDTVAVENLRRKYVYMIGYLMAGHTIWHGGNLAEIHQSKSGRCPFKINLKSQESEQSEDETGEFVPRLTAADFDHWLRIFEQ